MSHENQTQIIRNILFENWDPIGCGPLLPADEYDLYIPGIIHLLQNNCAPEQLEAHLVRIEKDWFGEAQESGKARLAATKLVANWSASH